MKNLTIVENFWSGGIKANARKQAFGASESAFRVFDLLRDASFNHQDRRKID